MMKRRNFNVYLYNTVHLQNYNKEYNVEKHWNHISSMMDFPSEYNTKNPSYSMRCYCVPATLACMCVITITS